METSTLFHLVTGFGMSISLIAAIGAQNAFILRQGIRREWVLPLVAICALSDAVLILAGVAGIGFLVDELPLALEILRWAGAAFLIGYGLISLKRAFTRRKLETETSGEKTPLWSAVAVCLALTWLNPHVYLDTVLLLGSLASSHGDEGRWLFGIGAATASAVWFTALGFGARLLRGVFEKPLSWRILDGIIAVVMFAIAAGLILR